VQVEDAASDYDREKMQERLAKLAGGVAVIKVGGVTEIEVKEKKDRVEDALSATRSAVEEGVVAGGGVALIRVQGALDRVIDELDDETEQLGVRILQRALTAPLRQLVENAGREASIIIADVRKADANVGYDVNGDQMGDMFKLGIIDPVKVVRAALENAVSVAALMLTTEALVGDLPGVGGGMPMGMPPDMGGMGDGMPPGMGGMGDGMPPGMGGMPGM
jgi:chaperonin GroEL